MHAAGSHQRERFGGEPRRCHSLTEAVMMVTGMLHNHPLLDDAVMRANVAVMLLHDDHLRMRIRN